MDVIEKSIQFIVNPQQDFIGHLHAGDGSLPNKLHVGADNVLRLRGEVSGNGGDPIVDTTMALLNLEYPGSERVSMVIDEDWHNSKCPEFEVYGRHCVKGTEGAELVGGLESSRWDDRVHILRANSINQASDPHYVQILNAIVGNTKPEQVRVGVYGVWTNIKVEYLLVNLLTVTPCFPLASIGVCEPLCAAPNPNWHTAAIDKFKMMGFNVFEDIPSYLKWMGVDAGN